jgi:hypothetical protein
VPTHWTYEGENTVLMEFSVEELAGESVELLPDRDTMQPILVGSFATNVALLEQNATSGNVTITLTVTP